VTGWCTIGWGSTVLRFTIVAIALPCGGSNGSWEASPATYNLLTRLRLHYAAKGHSLSDSSNSNKPDLYSQPQVLSFLG
jgi:hypothetical protein